MVLWGMRGEFGKRNVEGEMLLEFGRCIELCHCKCMVQERRLITYESMICRTVVEYVSV